MACAAFDRFPDQIFQITGVFRRTARFRGGAIVDNHPFVGTEDFPETLLEPVDAGMYEVGDRGAAHNRVQVDPEEAFVLVLEHIDDDYRQVHGFSLSETRTASA